MQADQFLSLFARIVDNAASELHAVQINYAHYIAALKPFLQFDNSSRQQRGLLFNKSYFGPFVYNHSARDSRGISYPSLLARQVRSGQKERAYLLSREDLVEHSGTLSISDHRYSAG